MNFDGLELIERSIRGRLQFDLDRSGILYRIFSRVKQSDSIVEKIQRKNYAENHRLVQDIIGVRITTYFEDDVDLLIGHIGAKALRPQLERDEPGEEVFKPVRKNMVCGMEEEDVRTFTTIKTQYPDRFKYVDASYEIQFRTTLSEGWHEVEHNMRYKCRSEWNGFENESRLLNGIYASLELGDNTLRRMFDRMAYSNYRAGNLVGLMRNKFRLRFLLQPMRDEVTSYVTSNANLLKDLHMKADRTDMLTRLMQSGLSLPITMENILFLANHLYLEDPALNAMAPSILQDDLGYYLPK